MGAECDRSGCLRMALGSRSVGFIGFTMRPRAGRSIARTTKRAGSRGRDRPIQPCQAKSMYDLSIDRLLYYMMRRCPRPPRATPNVRDRPVEAGGSPGIGHPRRVTSLTFEFASLPASTFSIDSRNEQSSTIWGAATCLGNSHRTGPATSRHTPRHRPSDDPSKSGNTEPSVNQLTRICIT